MKYTYEDRVRIVKEYLSGAEITRLSLNQEI